VEINIKKTDIEIVRVLAPRISEFYFFLKKTDNPCKIVSERTDIKIFLNCILIKFYLEYLNC
jgi:hypothetical protein